jgi:hypothetical protein
MLSKIRYVAKNINGLYWGSGMNDTTKDLWKAQRFPSSEYYDMWVESALYKPKDLENYSLIAIEQTIKESEPIERKHEYL